LVTHSLLITLPHGKYSALAHLHTLQHTVARVLGFFVFNSRFLATDLNTGTLTVSHSKYYTQIGPSNQTSILHRLTSCFLPCSKSQFALLFACFCRDYYSLVPELKLSLHSRLLIWNSPRLKLTAESKSKLCYTTDGRVGQSVLVSSTHLGLTTRFSLLPAS
jgi:hypothetical protein